MAEAKEIRRSLGRGLGSLLDVSAVDAPVIAKKPEPLDDGQRIWSIDIEKLVPNHFQPRKVFVTEKLQELASSIKEKGIIQPIFARRRENNTYEIIAGERRWRAAQIAGLQQVPVILKDLKNQESLEVALIENIQRHDLNPIDEAEAYNQLMDEFGLTQAEVSQKVGKDRATIANMLRLLGLAQEVKEMLVSGELSVGHAKALLVLTDPIKQKEVAKKISSEKLTVRAAEKLVQQGVRKQKVATGEMAETLSQQLAESLALSLGTKVEIKYKGGQGVVSISFYSDADLNQLAERLQGH